MNSDNVQAGTVTLEKLEKTGWVEWEDFPEEVSNDWRKSIGKADGLMNTANEFAREWDHDEMWTDDQGRERRPSQASMGNIVNGKDGYIIAGGNFAPWETKPTDMETWELPDTKWTDIMAVQWTKYAASSEIKRIYRSKIIYDESKALMESAMEKIGKSGNLDDLPVWPGFDFTPGKNPTKTPMKPETEAFMGLLGSSHAAGPAYLFIQYRAIFGKKRINKIKIWKSENSEESLIPNMLLYVEDVP
ncbi:hypothetical protein COCVIDRAFT_105317 [Bipolaris victoriae FI3]|uniref:Uncharacterized protein n=2 Tax=Bipolaris TaxID=33194 RepID=W6YCA5_COCC2|nr:uncharacterized protein COCCADRAFT_108233 [Bipolaris zeicola 26-R-13]XP_014554336.1 hypothetical protein COCVIDRAFT_105317 [Bipolaris victoriae FI3]EUC28781.1 hypothetical protein COCCADRAFT_108233 [Bipolaris zeicola 26-R-13]